MRILTLNAGSSSLKFSLYQMGPSESLVLSGRMNRIGLSAGTFSAKDSAGNRLVEQPLAGPDHASALAALFNWLGNQAAFSAIDAVGHRIVHGGDKFTQPCRITPDLIRSLQQLVPLAPDHMPQEVQAIEAVGRAYPGLPQVACFDTAFHRQMPAVAQHFALPRRFGDEGVLRYGFHGLSYEFIVGELRRIAGPAAASGRVIVAHLGNGASMSAIRDGQSVDTTMGFTPTGGLVMSTRSGDLDPGIILYLLRSKGLSPAEIDAIVNQQAGLLGVSETSSDMSDLLAQQEQNAQAAEAVALFCYQAKKFLAALSAVLGGVDTVVFTAGIGENAPLVRSQICRDLGFLGIELDRARNDAGADVVSADESRVTVRVIKTNEELMIARHTRDLLMGNSLADCSDALTQRRKAAETRKEMQEE